MTDRKDPLAGSSEPRHIEIEQLKQTPPISNPAAGLLNIVVSVPESIPVKMVEANSLSEYEMWAFMSSILSNASVGFLVAYFQALDTKSPSTTYVGWTTVVFSALLVVSVVVTFTKRSALHRKGRDVRLQTTAVQAHD